MDGKTANGLIRKIEKAEDQLTKTLTHIRVRNALLIAEGRDNEVSMQAEMMLERRIGFLVRGKTDLRVFESEIDAAQVIPAKRRAKSKK